MTSRRPRPSMDRAIRWGALALGIVLFFGTLYYINFRLAFGIIRQLGVALPLALGLSALWHLARTWAWATCFPRPRSVSFARLMRVRLAAEAFSYLTLRGIAGEPLKVVLLGDTVDARQATAAVALERMAYLIGTTIIVGAGSLVAMATLPLTHGWFRVFRAFAIAAAVVVLVASMVIAGRGTYFQAWLLRLDRLLGTSLAEGRISRFIAAVERQMLELIRGEPWRLAALMAATAVSYLCMALEAWVILRAAGASITPTGALAVETFSRVASFASAFIPANLGALEASSLAAVAAAGVGGGGAALALARRLRGLFWAGLGLALYPRRAKLVAHRVEAAPSDVPAAPQTLLYLPMGPGEEISFMTRLAGLPLCERVLRPARRAGYDRIVLWLPLIECAASARRRLHRLGRDIGDDIVIATTGEEWQAALGSLPANSAVTAIGPGTIVSTALLADARSIPAPADAFRDVPAGAAWPFTGVVRLAVAAASDPDVLRAVLTERRSRAVSLPSGKEVSDGAGRLALRITNRGTLAAAEATIRRASYKDTDANVARFNRRLSLPISIALLRTPLTANQLSVMLVALGLYSAWLFSTGHYWSGVLGGFLSLAASVLDGCDGEIARLKYQESALGCWIETVGDYSYYIAIFVGLTIGAARQTGAAEFYWIGGIALAGTLLTFALLIFLRLRITAGQPEKLHAIARDRLGAEPTLGSRILWRISFVATRAAMPYGIMAFALAGALPGIVVLAAFGANIYWVSLVVQLRHLMADAPGESVAA